MNALLHYEKELLGFVCQNNAGMQNVVNSVISRQSRSIAMHKREYASLGGTPALLTYEAPVLPIGVQNADGCRITDVDGNEYIDCHMAYTSSIMGHNPPRVLSAVETALKRGIGGGHLFEEQVELAELIQEMVGVERVAFFHTGGETINAAVRIARAVTGKRLVAKFEGCYHGCNEVGLHNTWMALNPQLPTDPLDAIRPSASTAGVATRSDADFLVLPFNSEIAFSQIVKHASELACVVADPCPPFLSPWPEIARDFVTRLSDTTNELSIPLIFDEVVCGFRLAKGGAREWAKANPQMSCFGKITSGLGIPLSVVAGDSAFLDATRTDGYRDQAGKKVWLSSTLSSSFIPVVASLAQLRFLAEEYDSFTSQLDQNHAELSERLRDFSTSSGIPIELRGHPRMQNHLDLGTAVPEEKTFRNLMGGMSPANFRSLLALTLYLRLNGIYTKTVPSVNLSAAHSPSDIDLIATGIETSLEQMSSDGMLPG